MIRDADCFEPDADRDPGNPHLASTLKRERIEHGNNRLFYQRAAWIKLKGKVLAEFRNACADHDGMVPRVYKHAMVVHHVLHVADYPQYALSEYVWGTDGKRHRNLVPLCGLCHSARHGRLDLSTIASRKEYLDAKAAKRKREYEREQLRLQRSVTQEQW